MNSLNIYSFDSAVKSISSSTKGRLLTFIFKKKKKKIAHFEANLYLKKLRKIADTLIHVGIVREFRKEMVVIVLKCNPSEANRKKIG